MLDAAAFHQKIARLRPSDLETRPDTFWVGVLKHNKKPTDDLLQTDCLWAKCSKNKDVSKIRKAYMSIEAPDEDIILRHAFRAAGFQPLPDHVLIQSMNIHGDDVVALEAVKKSDLNSRMVQEERVQLQNITETAATPMSTPVTIKAESQELCTSKPWSTLQTSQTELAWIDFNCERRELLQRVKYSSTAEEVKEMDDNVLAAWLQLDHAQIEFLHDRAQRIAAKLCGPGSTDIQRFASTSQGFWSYYYDEFYREKRIGNEPHRSFEITKDFFSKLLANWMVMSFDLQTSYLHRSLSFFERNPIPPMPQNPAGKPEVPIGMPKREPSPDCNASSKGLERTASPSVGKREGDHESSLLSASQAIEDEVTASSRLNLPDLFAGCSLEQLEKGVEKGVAILTNLRTTLAGSGNTDNAEAAQWLQSIDNVQKQAVRTRTVIGVVGNTGAGKSSVINALLDEERLLPTNCMRACTAVITEISYNYDSTAYSAEIEFISDRDWRLELETLFKDLLDGSGNVSRECTNEDNEAGIAYAKIKAVYPKLTRDDISKSSVEDLIQHSNVSRLLGSSRSIEDTDPMIFYKKLQSFVDSKEKTTKSEKDKSDKEKKKPREMEFWPLIKVVRLYIRAPALSTGAVIVDLPGVHDSNQARAAVAQNYMKQCTGLWICAPINRAVDDKAAKSLLGETFKRQLKMDGGFSTVTFICSKTDDISLMEAQDSLGIEEELSELWAQCDELTQKIRSLVNELEGLKDTKRDFSRAMDTADDEEDVWQKLKDDFEDGKAVYAPAERSKSNEKKRKRGQSKKFSFKKARRDNSDDDFIDDSSSADKDSASDEDSDVESEDEEQREPLTEAKILEKIGDLRALKKDGRRQKAQLDREINNVKAQIEEAEKEHKAVEAIIYQRCIQGRNEYSKGAIQQDFATGIKELDMEIQEEEDAANFNPDVDARDYDEVARSLPVFTVSSRAYQKLKGRFVKDKDVPGFTTFEETQIPQLQEHAKKTTESGRQASCRRFLNSMSQLLNSLRLWASSDGSSSNLTELQRSQEAKILKDRLDKLDKGLENSIETICASLVEELQENILDHFAAAVQHAITEAPNTADRWGAPVNRDDRASGGLHYSTYKALCRRDGLFTNSQGLHDWNTQLTDPIIKAISNGWERTFSRRMPSVLNRLADKSGMLLTTFHTAVEARAMKNGTSLASLEMLKQQLPIYKDSMKELSSAAQTQIATRQKDINREFVPVVAGAMHRVYEDCENERGPGSFKRMKALMIGHVDQVRYQMFNDSTNAVKRSLKKMVKDIEDFLLGKADEIFLSVKRDYESVVLGRSAASRQLPREQRQIRADVGDIIGSTELIFKKVIDQEPETPQPGNLEPVIHALEEKNASPTREVQQDTVMEAIEQVNGSNNHQDAVTFTKAETSTAGIEQTAERVIQVSTNTNDFELETAGSAPSPLLLQVEQPKLTETEKVSAAPAVADEQSDLQKRGADPLGERFNRPNTPAVVDQNKPSHDNSCKENKSQKARSMSSSDGVPAIDLEADERGFANTRSSSVASWVQSWFSSRD